MRAYSIAVARKNQSKGFGATGPRKLVFPIENVNRPYNSVGTFLWTFIGVMVLVLSSTIRSTRHYWLFATNLSLFEIHLLSFPICVISSLKSILSFSTLPLCVSCQLIINSFSSWSPITTGLTHTFNINTVTWFSQSVGAAVPSGYFQGSPEFSS